jgi:hypothetical protein
MKDDGFAGGQLFVLPVEMGAQSRCSGATTNIHFTSPSFASNLQLVIPFFVLHFL